MSEKLIEKIKTYHLLSVESKIQLLGKTKLKTLKKSDLILSQGQQCKNIYFIESGCLKSVVRKHGKEINLNFTLENNFITNLKSLRNGTPSEYYIQACEPSTICILSKDSLIELYKDFADIASFGRNLLEELLADQEEHSSLFKLKSPTERYQYIMKHNPLLLQKITLTQLSSYIGISRETLSRIRKAR